MANKKQLFHVKWKDEGVYKREFVSKPITKTRAKELVMDLKKRDYVKRPRIVKANAVS